MPISNISVTNVVKGFNLAGQVNELRYEIAATVSPGEEGVEEEQFTFDITNAELVHDAAFLATTTGGPGGGSGGGSGGTPSSSASVIAAIAGGSVDTIFPSLLSKIGVATSSDDAARNVLFRTPKLHLTAQGNSPAKIGLDVIPGDAGPSVRGTVSVAVTIPEYNIVNAIVLIIGSALG
jgi:hypothetical protein